MSNILVNKFGFSTLQYLTREENSDLVLKYKSTNDWPVSTLLETHTREGITKYRSKYYIPDINLIENISIYQHKIIDIIHGVDSPYIFTFKVVENYESDEELDDPYDREYLSPNHWTAWSKCSSVTFAAWLRFWLRFWFGLWFLSLIHI